MQTEIIAKATGTTTTTSADVIELTAPSVVRLNLDRSQVAAMTREGNDLIIRLTDGQTIRIDHFYDQQQGKVSDLVLREDQGSQWLANPSASGAGRFKAITDLDELIGAAATQEGGGSSFILPAILGVAGVGGLVAAVTGGGGNGGRTGDTQPPATPTASFTANGASVRGTGEAGATIRVTDGAGNVIGTGTVAADGTFNVPVNPPQTNGQPVTVVQSDAAGNVSPPATTAAPDITPPTAPTATITGDGRTVSGIGEPGATVTVRNAAGQVLGSAVVGAQGGYTLTLTTPQANGGTLTVTQADPAGNVSPAATLAAPDITPPAVPTATINGDGSSITGTGEPGATVTVRNAAGQALGTAVVGTQGGYTLTLTTPQANGGTLTVTQADPAGNVSPAVTLAAPDITPPAAPTASLSSDGTTVTGSGEPGATVRVVGPDGQPIGTAVVAADGSYTVTLTTAQTGGGVLVVTQTDAAGNVSPITQLDAVDSGTMPLPTAQIDAQGTTISGTGEPGATVIVRDANGQTIGQATVDADGNYSLTLATPQGNGETLTVVQSDTLGNVSPTITLTAPDFTAPDAPTATISGDGTIITGTGEPSATVTVRDAAGQPVGTATVDPQGNYTLPLTTPQANGETLTVTQSDSTGNTSPTITVSAPDITAPVAPTATIAGDGTGITGTGEPGATVTVRDATGQPVGTATVDPQGNYTLPLTAPQANGGTLTVTQSDPAGNTSPATTVDAPDITAPAAPTATIAGDGTSVTGTGEPEATVTVNDGTGQPLGTVTVDPQGNYTLPLTTPQANGGTLTVTQSDPAGNISPATTVSAPDITPPAVPTATITGDGSSITGTGEPGATVAVRDGTGQPLGTATVDAQGNYTLPLTAPQANGGTLTVTQSDPAGNTSPAATVNAPDITAPAAPTATITGDGTSITGTGEPGATVAVSNALGQPLGTATVDPQGNYTLPLASPQANGGTLTVIQSDPAGNTSPATTINAPDITPPTAPIVSVSADGTLLTGTGEPGAAVQVVDAGGQPVGTATVAGDGSFSVTLPAGVANGQTLSVVQTDAAGNASPASAAITPDLAAPAAPVATVSADGTSISGTGEPGATLVVRAPDGSVLATVTVAADGSFATPLNTPQANGETLTVTQSDAAGNVSPVATIAAPDITPPAPPLATLSADGTAVYGNGEPGATVRVVDGTGALLGSAVVAADSSYSLTLNPPQTSGQTLSATQTDPAGNPSQPATVAAPDLTAPPAPTATIAADGTSLTGNGEPFATVRVRAADGTVIATVVVGANGSFTAPLSPPQANGETLSLDQTDRGGNLSPSTPLTAPDITAPTGLTATISGDGAIVTGSGEAGAAVTIRDANGAVIGTTTVAANGIYNATLTTPQTNGETLQVTQADAAGNVSAPASVIAPDTTPPLAPAGSVVDAGATLLGTGEPGATVSVRAADGTLLGSGQVAPDGSFAVTLNPAQANGQNLQLIQTDASGNASPIVAVIAPDITAPTGLTATISGDGAVVTGVGEVGATVTVRDPGGTIIGTAVVGANGSYAASLTPAQINGQTLAVTQADAAGNVSNPLAPVAPDLTAPLAPVGALSADGTLVNGTGEPGATVTVRNAGGQVLGTVQAAADGSFSVPLSSAQRNGESLSVVQADAAGNVSPPLSLTALDTTAPTGLTASIDGTGSIVSGQAEAGAAITVRAPDGTIIGTGTASVTGAYALTLTTPQLNGQVLAVTQADAAGNTSPSVPTTAPDLTAPLAPVGTLSADGTLVNGIGEPGATVTVRNAGGQVLGTVQAAADGNFSVPLSSAQVNGQTLSVVQADAAGNVSPPLSLTALDTTAPTGLTASIDGTGSIVSGQAEAGATITVRDPGGAVIGTGTAGASGAYALTLTTPQLNGQVLAVTQADAAGNTSPSVPTTAPDLTAPLAPTGALSPDGTLVNGIGEPGATVTVRNAGGRVLGTVQVAADGSFSVPLSSAQRNGESLSVVQADAAGNVSPPLSLTALDTTAPTGLTASIDGTGSIVSGQAEAGAAITVRAPDGTIIGTGTAGASGAYALTLTTPQLNGQVLAVTQADAAGNTSPSVPTTAPDLTAPNAPLFTIDGTGATATGSGEVGATVTLRNASGTVIGTGQVGTDGTFNVPLNPAQANGGTVSATLTDAVGNVSTPTNVAAPDITPPAAPLAALDATGTIVSGQGEVGATVTVRGAGGVLGTAIVGPQGGYTVVLSTPQLNSQVLSVTQADAAGNGSLATTVTALDRTPPAAPLATVSADGTVVSGTGEIGATVTITDPVGLVLATLPVNPDGSFSVTLNPALTNGQVLTLTQADAAGNVSAPGNATAPDLIPNDTPGAPTATVAVDGTSVSGTGQVGAAIIVRNANGAVIGNTQVGADGSYTATLTTPQRNGETVRVTQTDADGDVSPPATAIAPDLTAPNAPVAAIDPTGTLVSGTGEAGATVRVLDANGATLGTAIVGANGAYAVTLTLPQVNGQPLTVVQSDPAGNASPASPVTAPDLTAPLAPVGTVSSDGTTLTGTGEVGATVTIRGAGGAVLGTAVVDANGNFVAPLTPAQANGQIVSLTQADAAGNVSPIAQAAAPDITAPTGLTAAINGAGNLVTGLGEAGATVTIRDAGGTVLGTAVVAANGTYAAILSPAQLNAQVLQVTEADAAGNVSTPTTVIAPDLTAPLAPIGTVAGNGTTLTGTGEAGATVTIRGPGGAVIGTAVVDANGNFSAPLTPVQANGQVLTLTQADAAGNVSPTAQAAAPDITAPTGLTAAINGAGNLVTGLGEAGATVAIRDAGGTPLGTAVVAANGTYAAILTPAQINAQALQVTQADAAGNVSTPATVIAPDLTAPLAPIGTVSGDGTTLTGTGEVGATVTIRGPGGTVIGTAIVDANGNFTAPLNPVQANGQLLTLTQADAAGNISPIAQAAAPDITAPTGLTAAIDSAGDLVTGRGEVGAAVTIRDPGGVVVGTAIVAANGTYAAILTPPQINAQALQVTQADAAGNVSTPATVVAPDLTAPLAPVGIVSGNGTTLTGTGEAGATVTIRGPGGSVIGTAVVDANGNFTAPLNPAQANGQQLTLTQADAAGNVSPVGLATAPDITAPVGLTAAINGTGSIVTGTGEAGATVTIRDPGGTVIGTAIVPANGSYSAVLTPAQLNAQTLQVTQADPAGNVSTPATVIAPDLTAPLAPIGTVSGNGATLTGTGEAGATVTIRGPGGAVIGTALVDANGNFTAPLNPAQANGQLLTLTQADAAGNVSPIGQATAPDITAPTGLTAAINGVGTLVTGLGEAGATVTVRGPGGAVIGTAIVAANGSYTVTLTTPQANGQALTVSQADAAGNASPPSPLTAPDITPPALPIATINGNGTIVTGSGEPGATVRILGPQGQLVGTATVDANGSYAATLTTPQANGQALTVTQVDGAGNVSPQAPLIAPDITPPALPTAAINGTGTIVTGTGEPGTTVEVRNTAGTVIGTGTVLAGGTYAVTLATPQVAGETLNVGLRDGAGNVSGTVAVIAPFDISAFDNVATAQVDLVPVQTNQNLGGANYTALVSLGLVNLDAQVLSIPNVQFTVQQGHRLNASFTYDATLSLGVASGYSVVVQRFNGTSWVAVNGGGNSSLLNVSLLGGDLVASADLGPGQYRAFVTFDNTAGIGLLGGLRVTGVDSDFTDVGQIVPATTNGNVITDPGPTGQVDIVSPQTRVESVTLNGVTTAVGTNSQVVGQWGTLTISSDGRYSYTPNADASVLGKTDRFTYTLLDASDGERESAALTITIGSPDITGAPIAVNDVATAGATFVNVVETRAATVDSTFATPTAIALTGARTGQITDNFTVDANSRGNITLSAVIAPGLSVVPSYTITVTNSAGAVVGTASGTALVGAGGLVGSGISVTMNNLPSGTYNYTVTSTNTLGLGYTTNVYVGGTITHLDQFALSGTTPVSGDLLANDTLGSDFLGIKMLIGGQFVDIGDAGRTLTGSYGTLTINEVGQYTYRPFTNLDYAATDPIDRFTYQLVQPDGQVSTARLDVAVDINNGVAPVFPPTLTAFALEDPAQVHGDVVPMTLAFEQHASPLPLNQADAKIALSLMEDQGSVEDVLSRYLDAQSPTSEPLASESLHATADISAMPSVTDIATEPSTVYDPLGYLSVSVDAEQERLATLHSI